MGIDKFLDNMAVKIAKSCQIDRELFEKFDVKRGLRNPDGSGVLVGLTNIGDVVGYERTPEGLKPVEGNLRYRGYSISEIVKGFQKSGRHGFDEITYLLLTGQLPNECELMNFTRYLADNRDLDETFTNVILTIKGHNIMNMLSRSVLILYTLDDTAEDYSHESLLRQSLSLIAKLPVIMAYAYHGRRHLYNRKSLIIRHPKPELSTAENILWLLRGEDYTQLEAEILDLAMVLHAEHGGGNNSTFTMRLVSSAETDTYSATASAIGSLKGRLHGGANFKVLEMMEDFKANIKDWSNEEEVKNYIAKTMNGETFDKSGKIYGMGHAIYTLSDPRAILLKERAASIAKEKGLMDEFNLYNLVEKLTPQVFRELKESKKTICANVDFYSGFIYEAIDIPRELFTPIFAISRMAGWAAHRMEEVTFASRRIIRPAYKNITPKEMHFVPLKKRNDF